MKARFLLCLLSVATLWSQTQSQTQSLETTAEAARSYQLNAGVEFFEQRSKLVALARTKLDSLSPEDLVRTISWASNLDPLLTRRMAERLITLLPKDPYGYQIAIFNSGAGNATPAAKSQRVRELLEQSWQASGTLHRGHLYLGARELDAEGKAWLRDTLRTRVNTQPITQTWQAFETLWQLELELAPTHGRAAVQEQIRKDALALRELKPRTASHANLELMGLARSAAPEPERQARRLELAKEFPERYQLEMQKEAWYRAHPNPTEEERLAGLRELFPQNPTDFSLCNELASLLQYLNTGSQAEWKQVFDAELAVNRTMMSGWESGLLSRTLAWLDRGFDAKTARTWIDLAERHMPVSERLLEEQLTARPTSTADGQRYNRRSARRNLALAHALLALIDKQPEQAKLWATRLPPPDPNNANELSTHSAAKAWMQWKVLNEPQQALESYRRAVSGFALKLLDTPQELRSPALRHALALWQETGQPKETFKQFLTQAPNTLPTLTWNRGTNWLSNNTWKSTTDKTWSRADWQNKVVIYAVWSSWCGPCREELRWLQELAKELEPKTNILILTLNVDEDSEAMAKAKEELQLKLPILLAYDFFFHRMDGARIVPQLWIEQSDRTTAHWTAPCGFSKADWRASVLARLGL